MPTKRREATPPVGVLSQCRHYWIIDSAQQSESQGRCQLCGEVRVFQNKMTASNKRPGMPPEAAPFELGPGPSVTDDTIP